MPDTYDDRQIPTASALPTQQCNPAWAGVQCRCFGNSASPSQALHQSCQPKRRVSTIKLEMLAESLPAGPATQETELAPGWHSLSPPIVHDSMDWGSDQVDNVPSVGIRQWFVMLFSWSRRNPGGKDRSVRWCEVPFTPYQARCSFDYLCQENLHICLPAIGEAHTTS